MRRLDQRLTTVALIGGGVKPIPIPIPIPIKDWSNPAIRDRLHETSSETSHGLAIEAGVLPRQGA